MYLSGSHIYENISIAILVGAFAGWVATAFFARIGL
jgi:preprotein translocase subunit SecF